MKERIVLGYLCIWMLVNTLTILFPGISTTKHLVFFLILVTFMLWGGFTRDDYLYFLEFGSLDGLDISIMCLCGWTYLRKGITYQVIYFDGRVLD